MITVLQLWKDIMKRIGTFKKMCVITVSIVLLANMAGCGSSYSVQQPLAATPVTSGVYVMGSCERQDNRAAMTLCSILQEQVRYGLFKEGLYEKDGNEAPREVNLTITYFNKVDTMTRAMLGVMSGKDGLDVIVDVKDRQSGEVVGRAKASNYNITAGSYTEKHIAREVSKKIVEFLASGVR